MAWTDQLKNALKKKQAAQHPDADHAQKENQTTRPQGSPPAVAKPIKKVTGRGR